MGSKRASMGSRYGGKGEHRQLVAKVLRCHAIAQPKGFDPHGKTEIEIATQHASHHALGCVLAVIHITTGSALPNSHYVLGVSVDMRLGPCW